MKKSWGHFALFVFVLALSIFVPVYILFTGSATLMPLAQAGAFVSLFVGLGLGGGTAAYVYSAERNASVNAHAQLSKAYAAVKAQPLWRTVFGFARTLAQVVLLLALGQPLFAAFVVCGLVGFVAHRGILESYFDRNPTKSRYSVKTAQGNDGKLYAAGFGVGVDANRGPWNSPHLPEGTKAV